MTEHPLAEPLRAFALSLPEAWEDHPWGENVAKVGKKVFVFFGLTDSDQPFGMTVKLPDSHPIALSLPWATSPGYGMDRTHWVWLKPPEDAPLDMLTEWIVESYRAVAPKKLAARLPETAAPP
jgi:predicted DNA-binding protein (MmcQ/YjbR family)